ncbi:MAG TPA: hypothetical protein VGF04_03785 [Solirubrobacterales bacterium]|jgi:hypothetical protein
MTTDTRSKDEELAELREEVSGLRRRLEDQREELNRELIRKEYRIGELEEAVVEKGKVFESTLSWRITKPIRMVRELLSRLRRR